MPKIEPGLSEVVVAGVSWEAGVAIEVMLAVSRAGLATGSATGGSDIAVGVSDGGVTDGGGAGETSRVGGVGGLLEVAVMVSVMMGAAASVTDATGALKVSGLGLGGSLASSLANSGVVVVVGREFVGRVVSCRGARRRLPKDVASGEKVVEGIVKVGFTVGFTKLAAASCGLAAGVGVPRPCGVIVFVASVVALSNSAVVLPGSAGLICAELNVNPVDPLPGGPKEKPSAGLEESLSSSLWPTRKPEKQPRVSPWALGAWGSLGVSGGGVEELTLGPGEASFGVKEKGSSDPPGPNGIFDPVLLAKENLPGGPELFA